MRHRIECKFYSSRVRIEGIASRSQCSGGHIKLPYFTDDDLLSRRMSSSRLQPAPACGGTPGTPASPAGSFSAFSDGRHIASASINVSYYWVSLERRSTTALNITALVEHNIFTGCSHEACFLTPAVNFSSSGSIDAGSHFGYI